MKKKQRHKDVEQAGKDSISVTGVNMSSIKIYFQCKYLSLIICFNCNKKSHYIDDYFKPRKNLFKN